MEHLLDPHGPLANWIHDWGYFAVFTGIMAENAGIPVPGETLIVLASVFAGQGVLRLDLLYAAVVSGAVIGDNLGYAIGLRGGRPLLHRLARLGRVPDAELDRAEAYFRTHADWAVFVGRFIALLRIFAGPLAGMVGMPWARFFLFNALGAVVWAAVVVGVAYKLGEHAATLLRHAGLVGLGIVCLLAAWIGYKTWRARRAASNTETETE